MPSLSFVTATASSRGKGEVIDVLLLPLLMTSTLVGRNRFEVYTVYS